MDVQHVTGDGEWGALLREAQERLERMVRVRMDPRVRGRFDACDVVQDAYLEAIRRRSEFEQQSALPFVVWLRFIALQKLAELHRKHLRVQSRSVRREVAYDVDAPTSVILAAQLLGQITSPSQAAIREDLELKLAQALDSLDLIDRECILLRSFERMTSAEAGIVLGLSETATSSRYVRALQKLHRLLKSIDGLSPSDWRLPSAG
jgi:RNA polymerase sigma-70 factor (ECF subfamily)